MKTLVIRYTVPVEVEVPDDFPVKAEEVTTTAEYYANDYCDGRFPHSVEDLHHAALRLAEGAVHGAVDAHYSGRLEKHFSRERVCAMNVDIRNSLAKRCQDKLGDAHLVNGGTVEVSVSQLAVARYGDDHVVLCRGDEKWNGEPGDYELATRTVFESRDAAEVYAKTIAESRGAIVAPMPFAELRTGEERGTLAYWTGGAK